MREGFDESGFTRDVVDLAGRYEDASLADLPRRVNRVLESLASRQLKLKVEMIDEGAVMD